MISIHEWCLFGFSDNDITDVGAASLSDALKANTLLLKLNLSRKKYMFWSG